MSILIDRPVETVSRADLERYARSDLGRSLRSLATSVVPFLFLWAAMFAVYSTSYWLVLALAIPAAGFLVRTYIMFHDCVHGSLMRSKRANTWIGTALGLLVFTPFARWRYEHLVHHATAGGLDRRFIGDVPMLTVAEYRAKPCGSAPDTALRHPRDVRPGSIYSTALMQRFPTPAARNEHRSVWLTTWPWWFVPRCVKFGWQTVLFVELPLVILAGSVGIWLFYVQHQFETRTGSAPTMGLHRPR